MTDRELMQQCLEAMNRSDYLGWQLNIPIIKALRERLAQKEDPIVGTKTWFDGENIVQQELKHSAVYKDEPVMVMDAPLLLNGQPLYTRPQPAAQWQGLTDEQISDLWCETSNTDFVTADTHVFARAIEAKLKEKNT